ncbi:MAG: histidine kinase [Acidimicrobiia bacterium]
MTERPWQTRFRWILSVWHWGGLMVGVFVSAIRLDPGPEQAAAGIVVGLYVLIVEVLPEDVRRNGIIAEVLVVAGVGASVLAVGLTGGSASPYLLFSLAPTFSAATFDSPRRGIATALLSAGGLAAVVGIVDEDPLTGTVLLYGALYLVVAINQAQARRLLIEGHQRAADATALATATLRMERLEEAHGLLLSLAKATDGSQLSPITVGEEALEILRQSVLIDSGLIAFEGEDGPIVVAKTSGADGGKARSTVPLNVEGREVGFVVVGRETVLTPEEHTLVSENLRSVAMAFDNIRILRDIAKRAVREERQRVARELHDEIGPSLASLGLALDVAVLQYPAEPALAAHLEELRGNVGSLVEDVRGVVSDLRHEARDSLVQQATVLEASVPNGGPAVIIDLDERRPPRPAIASDVTAIFTEAFRNVLRHANATTISIDGFVDRTNGRVRITDDGDGFDPNRVPAGHFGLVGIQERARKAGIAVFVESSPGAGTAVSIEWA